MRSAAVAVGVVSIPTSALASDELVQVALDAAGDSGTVTLDAGITTVESDVFVDSTGSVGIVGAGIDASVLDLTNATLFVDGPDELSLRDIEILGVPSGEARLGEVGIDFGSARITLENVRFVGTDGSVVTFGTEGPLTCFLEEG